MKFKSKNSRIVLFSLVGLVVLGAVVAVLLLTQPKNAGDEEQTEETTVDPALVMTTYDETKISAIEITNSEGTFKIIPYDNDGTAEWTVENLEIDHKLLDQSVFTTLVGYAASMTAKEVVEENAADLSKYGLDKPAATVSVSFSDGTSFGFNVGSTAPTGSAYYFTKAGGSTVYTYSAYKLNNFVIDNEMSFVLTSVMPTYDSETAPVVKKVTVKRTDLAEPIVLEALPEAGEDSIQVYTHQFTSPITGYLDLNTGDAYLYALYSLTANSAAYLMSDENKEKTGLDEPFCEVSMLVEDKIYRLFLGDAIIEKTTDEETGATTSTTVGYYGYTNQVPGVIYIFSAESAIWATMQPGDYMSKMFFIPYIYDLGSISYKDTKSDFTIKIEGDSDENHFFNGETEVDGDEFKKLYQFFIAAKGESFYTDEARGDLIATVTYTYKDAGTPADEISFYSCEDRTVIIAINGKNCYKTKQMYSVRLQENAAAFLSGGEIVLTY